MEILNMTWCLVATYKYLYICCCILLYMVNESANLKHETRLTEFDILEHEFSSSDSTLAITFDLTLENMSSNNATEFVTATDQLRLKFLTMEADTTKSLNVVSSSRPNHLDSRENDDSFYYRHNVEIRNLIQVENNKWLLQNVHVELKIFLTKDCDAEKFKLCVVIEETSFLVTNQLCHQLSTQTWQRKCQDNHFKPKVIALIVVASIFVCFVITFMIALCIRGLNHSHHCWNETKSKMQSFFKVTSQTDNPQPPVDRGETAHDRQDSMDVVIVQDINENTQHPENTSSVYRQGESSEDRNDNAQHLENTSSVYRQGGSSEARFHRSASASALSMESTITADRQIPVCSFERRVLLFIRPINVSIEERVFLTVFVLRREEIEHVRKTMAGCRSFPCSRHIVYRLSPEKNDIQVQISDISPGWIVDESSLTSTIYKTDLYAFEENPQSFCEFKLEKNGSSTDKISGALHVEQLHNPGPAKKLFFSFPFDLNLQEEDVEIEKKRRHSLHSSMASLLSVNSRSGRAGHAEQRDFNRFENENNYEQEVRSVIESVEPDSTGFYRNKVQSVSPAPFNFDTTNVYDMFSKRKGLAYILNNEFDGERKRHGSSVDFRNMKYLFEQLGYEIEEHRNLRAKQIMETISHFSHRFNAKEAQYRSCVVVLMSHGDSGIIYGVDDKRVNLKKVRKCFDNKKCPKLIGKPKLFFVQACRSPCEIELSSSNERIGTSSSHSSFDGHVFADKKLPENADMHIAHATTDGCLSLRHRVKGSWFVQAVVEVFLARAHIDNLDRLMKIVTRRVSQLNGKLYNHHTRRTEIVTQTPQRDSTLRKDFYFLPGFPP